MLQHALLLDVGPALMLVALRGPLLLFLLPRQVLGPLARSRSLRGLLRLLLRPLWTFVLWAGVLLAWHLPRAYDYALGHRWAHDLEHASFFAVGLLVWAQLVDPARRRALTEGGRVAYALLLFAAGHALLHPAFFAGGVLYPPYAQQPHRVLGLSPLADQHWAAVVMTVDQVLVLGTFVAVLLARRRHDLARASQAAA
jgi:putative membrane protein